MATQKAGDLRCSFCNKAQIDVAKLIAGPDAYICDECVDICTDIIGVEKAPVQEGAAVPLAVFESRHFGPLIRCRLCQTLYTKVDCVAFPNRGWLCGGCVDAVRLYLEAAGKSLK